MTWDAFWAELGTSAWVALGGIFVALIGNIATAIAIDDQKRRRIAITLVSLLSIGVIAVPVGAALTKVADSVPARDYDFYYSQGKEYREQEEYSKAIKSYSKAIKINPSSAKAYERKGSCYADAFFRNNRKAIEFYSKAIEIDPAFALAYLNRGITYENMQKYADALVNYNIAISLDENDARVYTHRASLYDKLGYPDLAEAARAKARELEQKQSGG